MVGGDSIGDGTSGSGALFEDGLPTPYDPNREGGPSPIRIASHLLLANDTFGGNAGVAAGLAITAVQSGAHTTATLGTDGVVTLQLEANYSGAASFTYTVGLAGLEGVAEGVLGDLHCGVFVGSG